MFKTSSFIYICVYTFLFSGLILVGKQIFFYTPEIQEVSIHPDFHGSYQWEGEDEYLSFSGSNKEDINSTIKKLLYENFEQKYLAAQEEKYTLRYIPLSLEEKIKNSYIPLLSVYLWNKTISQQVYKVSVFLYENTKEVRWKMKWGNIYMFWVPSLPDEEFLSVFIHEFAHYLDIYQLKKDIFWDESENFYSISWESTDVIAAGWELRDFVSGYAMTNKYEDFAESYTYFVLHNADFLKKSQKSDLLRQKYTFFLNSSKLSGHSLGQDFWREDKIQDYYWDITKLDVDIKKFLQYMQNEL